MLSGYFFFRHEFTNYFFTVISRFAFFLPQIKKFTQIFLYEFHADLKRFKQIHADYFIKNLFKSASICRICVKQNHYNPLICGYIFFYHKFHKFSLITISFIVQFTNKKFAEICEICEICG